MLQHGWTWKTLCQVKFIQIQKYKYCMIPHKEVPRVIKFKETESRMVIHREWEKRIIGYKISVWEDEIVLDGGDDWTTTWINLCC